VTAMVAGITLVPITFGATVPLVIAGAAIAAAGGFTTATARLSEAVLAKQCLRTLEHCANNYKYKSLDLQIAQAELAMAFRKLEQVNSEQREFVGIDAIDTAAAVGGFAFFRGIKGFYPLPILLIRGTQTGAMIASAVLGPLSLALDIGFFVHAVVKLAGGSKTDSSEKLRAVINKIHARQIIMKTWLEYSS
jgi:hypothetical protein